MPSRPANTYDTPHTPPYQPVLTAICPSTLGALYVATQDRKEKHLYPEAACAFGGNYSAGGSGDGVRSMPVYFMADLSSIPRETTRCHLKKKTNYQHLLEPEILASAEADLMITGLDPSLQHDLARIICGFNPLIEPSDLPLSRIAADLRAVAIEILQRHTFQDRYVSDLQAALDAGRRGSNLQVKASLASLDHDPHMNTYMVEEEDDDESDAGDLFAFLPPSTADQQRTMHDERTQDSFNHSSDYGHLFPNAVPPDPYPVAYPTPTFDPYCNAYNHKDYTRLLLD
ncbi:hypothetical protein EDD15DRAFT_2371599 [Pisolithus albus]|nr:hypothetical protein EDD15DRAFT_2371599 [Pisolithus albus]